MFIFRQTMDTRRTLLLLILFCSTKTMPMNRGKRDVQNQELTKLPEYDVRAESTGNEIIVDTPADFGLPNGDGQSAFTLSLRDDVSNITMDLVKLVFTEDENGQSSTADDPRDRSATLATELSLVNTGHGSESQSKLTVESNAPPLTTVLGMELMGSTGQMGNNLQVSLSSESASQESSKGLLSGPGSVSSSVAVSQELNSNSSPVSTELASSSVSVSVELNSNSIEVSSESLSQGTDLGPASASQESMEASLQSQSADLPSYLSIAPTDGTLPDPTVAVQEEESDEDEIDEDDIDEDEEEEAEPSASTSPPSPAVPTETVADPTLAPELKDPFSGETMLADQPVDLISENNFLNVEVVPLNLQSGGIDEKNNPIGQTSNLAAADQTLKSLSLSVSADSTSVDLTIDPISATEVPQPQPDPTTVAPKEEGDEDELDEDELDEDEEEEAGGEVIPSELTPEVPPADSTVAPPTPALPTGNAVDAPGPPAGIAADIPTAPELKDPCNGPGCHLDTMNDPLLDTEGFVGDDPQAYTVDQVQDTQHVEAVVDTGALPDTPVELKSELTTDLGTAPANQDAGAQTSQKSLGADSLADSGVATTSATGTEAPLPADPTTVSPETEGDEDDVDEDEVDEDEEDEAGSEATAAPSTSVSPADAVLQTVNAEETPVAPAGLAADAIVGSIIKAPCTDPACDGLSYDAMLDTQGFLADDPLAYAAAEQEPLTQELPNDKLTDKQTLPDAPTGLTSDLTTIPDPPAKMDVASDLPQAVPAADMTAPANQEPGQSEPSVVQTTDTAPVDPTTTAPEEEGDEDEVDEDEVDEEEENETGGEVPPSVTPEASPTPEVSPALLVVSAGNAVDTLIPPSGITANTQMVPNVKESLIDTEGYMGDDPLAHTVDQLDAGSQSVLADKPTDLHTVPVSTALQTKDLNSVPGLDVSSTAPASVEILVLPSNVIQVEIELNNPHTGPGPAAITSQESVEIIPQALATDIQSVPSVTPAATQAPQPDPTTAAAEEEEGDEDEMDDDEDDTPPADPTATNLKANPPPNDSVSMEAPADSAQASSESSLSTLASEPLTLNAEAPSSVEAASMQSQVSAEVSTEQSPSSLSVSAELPSSSVEVSAEATSLPVDPSVILPATSDPQPATPSSPEEEEGDEDEEEEEDETAPATQAPVALVQEEPLSLSDGASVSVEAQPGKPVLSPEPLLGSIVVSLETHSNSSEVSKELANVVKVPLDLHLNNYSSGPDVAAPNPIVISISIENDPALGSNLPGAPAPPSALQIAPGAGTAGLVAEAVLTSSEERLAEQERAETALGGAGDIQGNPELVVANPWMEFLRSLGTPSIAEVSHSQSIAPKRPLSNVVKSSSEEN